MEIKPKVRHRRKGWRDWQDLLDKGGEYRIQLVPHLTPLQYHLHKWETDMRNE